MCCGEKKTGKTKSVETDWQTLEETADKCKKFGGKVITVCCDLHNVDEIITASNQCTNEFGSVDILVNAGIA